MAPTKRMSAGEEEHHSLNKRHKRGSSVSKKTKSGSAGEVVVPIEKLAWREVPLPDRLEDAEGFFGLEEIEDVEIVRDTQSGTIVYKVRQELRNSSI